MPTCSPHSVLSVPAQRPSAPGARLRTRRAADRRVALSSTGGTAGRGRRSASTGPSRSSRPAGCISTSRASRVSTNWVLARVSDCSRRMPVIQASAPASERSSAATLGSPQQWSGPPRRAGASVLDGDVDAEAIHNACHAASVSGKRTPVSMVRRSRAGHPTSSSRIPTPPSGTSRGRRAARARLPSAAFQRRPCQTAHSPSPRCTTNGAFVQSMNWSIVSRPNSTGIARSRTSSSNASARRGRRSR